MKLKKPKPLYAGDTIATVSVSLGLAGDADILWKYELGKKRLEEMFELQVQAAPNSMKGSQYLENHPQARAEDIMWAFENKNINAIIANIGGYDSIKLLPFIDTDVIKRNPKIFIGYSDAMNVHLLCYKAGLSTFYGHNLLPVIAEAQGFHRYSEKWFRKTLFDNSPIGVIEPADDWAFEVVNHSDKNFKRSYYPNSGYELIQGRGIARGHLIGGHTDIITLENKALILDAADFDNAILFIEDIPECFSSGQAREFFVRLGKSGILQKLSGIIIGKICENVSFDEHGRAIKDVISNEFQERDLPVLYGLNFGHSSPIFIIPYGAKGEINCDLKSFAILDSGVE
ncbi:MAG: LD-carboxypeptidase [Oscillospiraceae bacterium]|nr:LD-carboxypeptidase [Oscillospiraceae bacterium]